MIILIKNTSRTQNKPNTTDMKQWESHPDIQTCCRFMKHPVGTIEMNSTSFLVLTARLFVEKENMEL